MPGRHHSVFPMEDASRVGEARRFALQLAHECGFDDVDAGRVALVVTELGNNLARHASKGRLWIAARGEPCEIEVLAVDRGPGIADLHRSMVDGYSTGGTPGTGLGAVRRLAQDFDVASSVPAGTVMVARLRPARPSPATSPAVEAAGVCLTAPGETVCGDCWGFAVEGSRAALMVADGLGHGPDAAEPAQRALALFRQAPLAPPREILAQAHTRLRGTRGAAITIVQADAQAGTLRMAGAGNVVARVVSGVTDRTLLGQHGTAGVTIRTPDEVQQPWPAHALLVVCSDGIETRWNRELLVPVLQKDPALAAALLARDHCRGRDDATAVVLRRKD